MRRNNRSAARFGILSVLALGLITAACAEETPTGPSDPGDPGGPQCRTYITSATATSVSNAGSAVTTYSGTFNASTNQTTYNGTYADSGGNNYTFTQVTSYPSRAAAVDEVRVIPPLTLWARSVFSGGLALTVASTFDGQGRLTRMDRSAGISTVYSAWDSNGRPTAGTQDGRAVSIVYDNAARRATTTLSGLGTIVETYDTNGNILVTVESFGSAVATTTTNILSTGTICR